MRCSLSQMPRYFWETALALKNDAARLTGEEPVNHRALRALQSRVRSFTARIEAGGHQRLEADHTQGRDRLLAMLVTQATRIGDLLARHVSHLRRAWATHSNHRFLAT